jgi:hypothetical protein
MDPRTSRVECGEVVPTPTCVKPDEQRKANSNEAINLFIEIELSQELDLN